MKTVTLRIRVEPAALYDEIVAGIPDLSGTFIDTEEILNEDGTVRERVQVEKPKLTVFSTGLTVVDDADKTAIAAIVKKHDAVAAEKKAVAASLRLERNKLLLESDWTQLPDAPVTDQKRREWVTYRQTLRDLPTSPNFNPADPVWPEVPVEG